MATPTASASFREAVQPHLRSLYALAVRLVGHDAAEDVLQDCLIRAHRGFGQLREADAVGSWLRTILLNLVRDRARHDARRAEELPTEHLDESYSLYRRIADEDPLPYSDSVHLDFLSCFSVRRVGGPRSSTRALPHTARARAHVWRPDA